MKKQTEEPSMHIKKGIPVSPGIAFAPAVVIDAEDYRIPRRHLARTEIRAELARVRKALADSAADVAKLRGTVTKRFGRQTAAIFDMHWLYLRDRQLYNEIADTIRDQLVTAEYATSIVLRQKALVLLESADHYMAERVTDIYDIERRILHNLIGDKREDISHLSSDVVVIAHDLTPSQTAHLDNAHVKGLATDAGGRTSHSAIVAHALGIPAVVGLNDITALISGGDELIIDGTRGAVVIKPDEATIQQYRQYQQELISQGQELRALRDLPAVTKCGTKVKLFGNIEFPHEAQACLDNGAEGIGLYRTEFLHLGAETEPSEQDHYEAYCAALKVMGDRPLIIRTLDLGADKYTQAKAAAPERNPFLGCRSIRFCLQSENLPLFRKQLRALLRASEHGDIRILLPLITTLTELHQSRMVLGEVMEELDEQDIAYRHDIPVGIMVETPSAALSARIFAPESAFFSIGTNDLIQYTLAVDRANECVASLFTAANPALIGMIRDVIKVGKRNEIPVALCGEMASEPEFCLLLLGLGLRIFSVAPQAIPTLKQIIRASTMKHAQRVARRAMTLHTDRQITHYLRRETRKVFPELV